MALILVSGPYVVIAQDVHDALGKNKPLKTSKDTIHIKSFVRFQLDNDLFSLRDTIAATDYDYTHGMSLSFHGAGVASWVRKAMGDTEMCNKTLAAHIPCLISTLGLRQAIFTPASNYSRPVIGQRPHAGYLGAFYYLTRTSGSRQTEIDIDAGFTGRLSLASELHGVMHALTGTERERGWDNQISTLPAISVGIGESYNKILAGGNIILLPSASWKLVTGNLRRSASGGVGLLLNGGRHTLWAPNNNGFIRKAGPYLSFEVSGDRVWHDLFLDGHGVDSTTAIRLPHVWQTTLGFGWLGRQASLEYRHIRRGREYEAQKHTHTYGSIQLTINRGL